MWKEGDLKDDKVCIKIERQQFVCNRTTLSLHSAYFEAMFRGNFIEKDLKTINLKDVNVNGFSNILKYIEQNGTNTKFKNVLDTIECASMLQFLDIHKILFDHLLPELNIDNCLQIWQYCEFLDIHPLLEQAKFKAYNEFHQVINTDYFQKLEPKQLHSYLSNTFIHCYNEMEIFEAGMKWWFGYSSNLKMIEILTEEKITKYLLLVLSCIDFKSINLNDIDKMLNHCEIKINKKILTILIEMQSLLRNSRYNVNDCFEISVLLDKNNIADVRTYEELDCNIEVCEETKRLFSNSRRVKKILNCIVTSERGETNAPNLRIMNISYYDEKSKSFKKVFDNNSNFQKNCLYILKTCKIIPFNENLLLIGGKCRMGDQYRIVNDNCWIYYTDKDEWKLISWFSKYRSTCAIITPLMSLITRQIGSRVCFDGLFYIRLHQYYWDNIFYRLSSKINTFRYCIYKNEILFLSFDNSEAYLFNKENTSEPYRTLLVERRSNNEPDLPENSILFSIENYIYIKDVNDTKLHKFVVNGSKLLEINVATVQGELTNAKPIYDPKFRYILDKNNLYVFTKYSYYDVDDDRVHDLELHCLDINSKINKKLVEIKNEYQEWHMHRGCFQFSHYKALEFNSCISEFIL